MHNYIDVSHIPGYANELADMISRMNLEEPLPPSLQASDRIRISLDQIWHPTKAVSIFPKGSTVSWPLP